ncbi:MAG: dihydrodipicolinate synthase family protein [Oscillospiraceae bacterium]|nr:dihydrodipicolinate synthase family protein [Oscillospiraceae bacterium]
MKTIPGGAYPAMLTPFTMEGAVDYPAVVRLMKWYEDLNCAGVLALCASSETETLSLEERTELAKVIVANKGRMTVVLSGHVGETMEEQITEMNAMASAKPDALCFITARINKLAENDDDRFIELLDELVDGIEDKEIPLGFYEQPSQWNKPLNEKILRHCLESGRYVFCKETSCRAGAIKAKIDVVRGTNFGIYNANSSLLLQSLKDGAAGFCGIMGNIHPDLYQWLCENWQRYPGMAEHISDYLGVSGEATSQYPAIAKYFINMTGAEMTHYTRRGGYVELSEQNMYRMGQLDRLNKAIRAELRNLK